MLRNIKRIWRKTEAVCILLAVLGGMLYSCTSEWKVQAEDVNDPLGLGTEIMQFVGHKRADILNYNPKLRTADGQVVHIAPGAQIHYGGWSTNEFLIDGKMLGYCAEPNSATPSGNYTAYELNNDLVKACLMCAPGGPLDGKIDGFPDGSIFYDTNVPGGNKYANAHAAIGYVYSGDLTGLSPGYAAGIKNFVQMADNIKTNGTGNYDPAAAWDAWKVMIAPNNNQDIVWLEEAPRKGTAKIVKTSANPVITLDNSCYGLEGAYYGVWKDRECTAETGLGFMTGADGTGNLNGSLDAGTYYVRELTAPKGYALDTNVYEIVIKANETTTLEVRDYPQNNPVTVMMCKEDEETLKNKPQGNGMFENAEFIFKYYGVESQTDPAEAGIKPSRTWVMRTDGQGIVRLSDEYKISGDDFYYDSTGNITLPLGVVTIQETKAPEGYLLNDEVFVRQITADGTAESVNTYQAPIVPEAIIRGDVEIVKLRENEHEDEDTIQGIEGVEFTFTSDTTGEVVKVIVTDENGFATTEDPAYPDGSLLYDTYTITETKCPKGLKPIEPFRVSISENGVVLKGIYKENKMLVSPVTVVKVDASTGETIPAADTEFRLLDENKKPVIMTTHYPDTATHETFKTDAAGQFTFPKKLEYGIYYLEELHAPDGYLKGELLKFEVTGGTAWEQPFIIKYADEPAKGKIKLVKKDAVNGEVLPGVEFEIKAAEDIVTLDGTVRAEAGDVVDYLITDENGTAGSKELYLGKYIVKETKQAPGYILADSTWNVELKYKDQYTEIVTEELLIENKPIESGGEEEKPKEALKTGDGTELMPWILLIIFAAAMIFTLIGKYKQRR